MNFDLVTIDGSQGEGGGQILRTSLTMSLLTGRPFKMTKIRANRDNPGLGHQHLAAIEAAKKISGSEAKGAEVKSQNLEFYPGKPVPGKYLFKVNTAGAMTLVLQTVLLPLALTQDSSQIEFQGGTHVFWAPCYEYVHEVWGSVVKELGLEFACEIHSAGFYPRGGGAFSVYVNPLQKLYPLTTLERPALRKLTATCILGNLPASIAERELAFLEEKAKGDGFSSAFDKKIVEHKSPGTGNVLFLKAQLGHCYAGFTGIGEKGKSAEKVAEEVWQEFSDFWKQQAPVEQYLADQLLLPLLFAQNSSAYKVAHISQHLLTNAEIIQKFSDKKIKIAGEEGQSGIVEIIIPSC